MKRFAGALPVLAIFGLALILRVLPAYHNAFGGGDVRFCSVDIYYYLRQVDSLVKNFPRLFAFDPYLNYPGGLSVGPFNFFVYLLGTVIWLLSRFVPGQHALDAVSAYFPAALGALTVVPTYFLGKSLFDRRVGMAAAALLAVLPAEVVTSVLGNTQRDVLEVLLTTTTMLFLVLAVKSAKDRAFTFQALRGRGMSAWKSALAFSLLCGVTLGLYILTWRGSFLFVGIILLYAIIQSIIDYYKNVNPDYLALVSGIVFLTALLIFGGTTRNPLFSVVLAGSWLITLGLWGLARLLRKRKVKPLLFPLAVLGAGALGLVIILIARPTIFSFALAQLRVFAPSQTERAVMEMQPIFSQNGHFTLRVVWGLFNVSFFLSLIALGMLAYLSFKHRISRYTLLLIWGATTLLATLDISRMAPFFAITAVLLSGYLAVVIYYLVRFAINYLMNESNKETSSRLKELTGPLPQGVQEYPPPARKPPAAEKSKKAGRAKPQATGWAKTLIAGLAVFFLVFFPNFHLAVQAVDQLSTFAPDDAWSAAMGWLKENTPAPFGKAMFYYEDYQSLADVPSPSYTVAALWDYGYWIARTAQRCPTCDPGGGAREQVARLLLAQDESSAVDLANSLNLKYLIVDDYTVSHKFSGPVTYTGADPTRYYETYYRPVNGVLQPVTYYYPEYYQSLAVRLYSFDGAAFNPSSTAVISYTNKLNANGQSYKEIQSAQNFNRYQDAIAFTAKQTTGNYRIASSDFLLSPVPLLPITHFQASYSSVQFSSILGESYLPEVRIFVYKR